MKHYVYKITDPITNEYYIGSRSCKCDITNDSYMGSYKTWKPIDKERLVKIILKDDFSNRNEAIDFEIELIKENIDNELNRNYYIPTIGFCTFGNKEIASKISKANYGKRPWNYNKVGVYSKDTIQKMSNSAKGRIFSDDTKIKISNKLKGKLVGDKNPMYDMVGDKNPNYGNKWTDEQKITQSKKLKGKVRSAEVVQKMKKPILQYSLDNNFIKEWDSLSGAAKSLDIYVGCINNCLRGRTKSSYGFIWKYKN
jgi:hypothetical protein